MKLKLDLLEVKLDNLLKEIDAVKDDEIKAHLSRYFCIRISGYLENVVKALTISYCENSSSRPISNYLEKELKNLTNLSEEKLLKFLQKFSTDWEYNFSSKFTEKQRASLNSIISNRNNIAHGQSDSISYKIVRDYYVDVKEIVQLLKKVIKK